MTSKDKAIKKANDLGYTICYHEDPDELRFRKPGAAHNSLNMPYEYFLITKLKRSWKAEKKIEPLIM